VNPVIVFSRMSSTRLPGKALESINGKPLLQIVCERLLPSFPGRVIVATGLSSVNDPIRSLCSNIDVPVFSGSDNNLVSRTIDLIDQYESEYFIRVNGDTPFVDASLLKSAEKYIDIFNIVSNIKQRTFPYGISVEIVRSDFYRSLESLCLPIELEHVTMHLYRVLTTSDIFNVLNSYDALRKFPRYVVDTASDLKFIREICSQIDPVLFTPDGYSFNND
jgi:spore coat polysaccharide biosynthesis protein SpsF